MQTAASSARKSLRRGFERRRGTKDRGRHPVVVTHPGNPDALPGLTVQRALSAALGLERQLSEYERDYRDREDLPGLHVFLRVLQICAGAIKHELIQTSRQLAENPSTPDPEYRPDPLLFAADADADESNVIVPLVPELSIQFMDQFELQLTRWRDLLVAPQGSSFDALAGPFRHLARRVPNADEIELIFRPLPERLYGVWFEVTDGFDEIARYLDADLAETLTQIPKLIAIEYPLLHEHDTYLHSCIAHEIGHIALNARPPGNPVQRHEEIIWTEAALELRGDSADVEFQDWFAELGCDLLAIRLLGPAYALALTEWTVTQNVWFHTEESSGYETHPPMPWRLERLAREVDRYLAARPQSAHGDVAIAWDKAEAVLTSWKQMIPSIAGPAIAELDVIERALEKLDAQASAILAEAEYRPAEFAQDLAPAWRKLDDRMAPAEAIYARGDRDREGARGWSAPIDWRSILNVGYLHFLHEQAERADATKPPQLLGVATSEYERRSRACTHIQGAIELSELHRAMQKMKDELVGLEEKAV